ncbi:MAG: hypothetical protein EAX86_06630 [Candidatus Heimdallarchaeota archaeon]|nr:hypothetical protein [Candidatus Heimdallarchaeota archaeon]
MIAHVNFYLGMIALIIYTIKLRPWREYHILLKILIIWMLYEIICQGFLKWPVGRTLLWLDLLPFEYWFDPQFLFNLISPAYHLLILLPETFSGFYEPYKVLSYAIPLFLVYNYIVTKPEAKTKKIKISRIFWIVFGFSSIVLEIVYLFDVTNLLALAKDFEWHQLFSVR